MLYTTNAVESLNFQLRKVLRNRGPFPNDDAVKVLLLAIQNAKSRWNASKNWNQALSQLDIFFEGRLPASVNLHRNSDTLDRVDATAHLRNELLTHHAFAPVPRYLGALLMREDSGPRMDGAHRMVDLAGSGRIPPHSRAARAAAARARAPQDVLRAV